MSPHRLSADTARPIRMPRRADALRTAYRERASSSRSGDLAYLVYLAVLLLALVGFPIGRVVVLHLAAPQVVGALTAADSGRTVGAIGGLLLALAAWAGGLHGLLFLRPFQVLLTSTDLPRRHTLLHSFASSTAVVAATAVAAAGLPAGVLVGTGAAGAAQLASFMAAAGCFGVLVAAVWLGGQLVRGRGRWLLPAVLLGVTALTVLLPGLAVLTPWGWLGLTWVAGAATLSPALPALALAAVVACGLAWHGLDLLDGDRLLEEAQAWQVAWGSAAAGEVAVAMAGFRARPSVGRSWQATGGRSATFRYLRSDIVGLARTPGRLMIGSAALVLACALLLASPVLGSLLAALGSGLAYLAIGVFSDGFRLAAETGSGPAVIGFPTDRLFLLHALLPLLVVGLALLIAALAAGLCGLLPPPVQIAEAAVTCLGLALTRAFDSAKGPMPPRLLTPMPGGAVTGGTDLSGAIVLIWQMDALLIAMTFGLGAAVLPAPGLVVFLTVAGLGLILGLRRRLRTN